MNQNKQPDALRLADELEKEYGSELLDDAADMLRRQHARIAELEAQTAHMADLVEQADYAHQKMKEAQARVRELEALLKLEDTQVALIEECKAMPRVEALKTYRNKTGCTLEHARDALFPEEVAKQAVQPIGYIHPQNIDRLNRGEPVAVRKHGWGGEPGQLAVFAIQPIQPTQPMERVPLTDGEVWEVIKETHNLEQCDPYEHNALFELVRAAELAHGITQEKQG